MVPNVQECSIELPLPTDPLSALMKSLKAKYSHNFLPCVMAMASAVFVHHYIPFHAE